MPKSLLLAGLLLGLASCQSERLRLSPTGVYSTAASFRQQQPSLAGSQVSRSWLRRRVFVADPAASGSRTKVSLDTVWGYAGANGRAYRVFKRGTYQVEQPDTLTIYSQQELKYLPNSSPGSNVLLPETNYYFSAGLAGPVQPLTKKNLRRAFANNPTFLQLLQHLKWSQALTASPAQPTVSRTYKIVDLYRQSLALPTAQPC